jgi:hypothetical protein
MKTCTPGRSGSASVATGSNTSVGEADLKDRPGLSALLQTQVLEASPSSEHDTLSS